MWTAGEQLFFADKNFKNEPKRCKACKAKRASRPASAPAAARAGRDPGDLLGVRQGHDRAVPADAGPSGVLPRVLPAAEVAGRAALRPSDGERRTPLDLAVALTLSALRSGRVSRPCASAACARRGTRRSSAMQIEERIVGDVTILDLKGKMTLGEGDELLQGQDQQPGQPGAQEAAAEPRGRALHRQRGPRRDRAHLHDGQPAGRQAEAAEPDQADRGPAVDHQAADGVRDVRHRRGSGQELRVSRGGPRPPPALAWRDRRHRTSTCPAPRPQSEAPGRSLARSLLVSLRPEQWTKNLVVFAGLLFGRQLFDPDGGRPRRRRRSPSSARCRASSTSSTTSLDREADRRHPLKARRPIASGALSPARRSAAAARARRRRRWRRPASLGRGVRAGRRWPTWCC